MLLVAVFLVYQPAWHGTFVWDDDAHITHPALRSWEGLGRIWWDPHATQQYYPLSESLFWVEYKLWGDLPLGYHLVNIFVHALSAFLLLKILRRLEIPGAWLAAGIFALHPVQVESVAWVTELKNVLSGMFYLGAALAYLEFDQTRKTKTHVIALVLFILGLMSKTVIAPLPAALLVVFWWKRGKLSWKQDVLPLIPFFIVGIFSGFFTSWLERRFLGAEGSNFNFTIIERVLMAGRATCFYLGKLFWPTDLIFINPRWQVSETVGWQYLFPVAILLLVLSLGMVCRHWRGPLAGFLFFVGTLFPALGFFNVYFFRYSLVTDHFQYLACLGIIVPFAAGLVLLSDFAIPKKPWLQSGLGIGLLLVLGTLSWQRAWAFTSEETLWNDTLAKNPDCWMARNNLGNLLLKKGHLDEARSQYLTVLEINPNDAKAHDNLGNLLSQKGQVEAAKAEFEKALEIEPNFADAHNNLGVILFQNGQLDEAMAHYKRAMELRPDYAEAHNNVGNFLVRKGQIDEAMAEYQKALEIDPTLIDAHNNLGNILGQKNEMDEAIVQYQDVLKINPNHAEAHNNLGIVLFQKGRTDEAMAEFEEAMRLKPGYKEAQDNLNKAKTMIRQKAVGK